MCVCAIIVHFHRHVFIPIWARFGSICLSLSTSSFCCLALLSFPGETLWTHPLQFRMPSLLASLSLPRSCSAGEAPPPPRAAIPVVGLAGFLCSRKTLSTPRPRARRLCLCVLWRTESSGDSRDMGGWVVAPKRFLGKNRSTLRFKVGLF